MNFKLTIRSISVLLLALVATTLQAKDNPENSATRPLSFTENKGQVTDQYYHSRTDIDFKMETPQGMNIFLGDGQLHYQWNKSSAIDNKSYKVESYRLDVVLLGANKNAEMVTDGRLPDYDQYYREYLPQEGARAYSYNKVTYKNVYPNIDWVLYSSNNELKYDFVVHAGGDPALIQLKYEGATSLINNNGAVTIATPMGSITEGKPYTCDAETRETIGSSFLLTGNTLGFNIDAANRAIVIDPPVNWITYYGGSGLGSLAEFGPGIATDAAGNVYMAGKTYSNNNIATAGAFQAAYTAGADGMVVKFNKAGVRQWGTYYGGSNVDILSDVALDFNGNIYCAGYTESIAGIATPGAYLTTGSGGNNTMLVKFDNNGNRIWGTYYYGGYIPFNMNPAQVCCDASGNAYINYFGNGLTVAKFLPSGAPQWNTSWTAAGSSYEGSEIVADLSGNIYVVGDDQWTVYLGKINASGINVYTNSIGGSDFEQGFGVTADAAGNVYVSGHTRSATGIATAGTERNVVSPTIGTTYFDGFLMKYNSTGVKQWGTYVGNPNAAAEYCAVTLGLNGKLYVAHLLGYQGPMNVSTYDSQSGLRLSTFALPGNNESNYASIAWSPAGNIYVSGLTWSTSGLATAGAHQTTLYGDVDLFLASYTVDTIVAVHEPFHDTVHCAGAIFKLPYDVNSNFAAGNTFTAYLSDDAGSFASPVSIGSLTSSVSDTIVCTIPLSAVHGTGYRIRIAASNPVFISEANTYDIRIDTNVTPAILTYTAAPGTTVGIGTSVTFSTTLSGVGATPAYQWKKNSTDIPGATGATYTGIAGTDFITNDTITVEVTSSVTCASPSSVLSSPLIMTVQLGIANVAKSNWQIYPNPTAGNIIVQCNLKGKATIQILNMAGQVMYTTDANAVNGKLRKEIETSDKLTNGIYFIRITSGEETYTTKFLFEK